MIVNDHFKHEQVDNLPYENLEEPLNVVQSANYQALGSSKAAQKPEDCTDTQFYFEQSQACVNCPPGSAPIKLSNLLTYNNSCACGVNQQLDVTPEEDDVTAQCICDSTSINVEPGTGLQCRSCNETLNNGLNISSAKNGNTCQCSGNAAFNAAAFECYCSSQTYFTGAKCMQCPAFTLQDESTPLQCKCSQNLEFISTLDGGRCGCTGNMWLNNSGGADTRTWRCIECPEHSQPSDSGDSCVGDGREFDPITGQFIGDPIYVRGKGLSGGAVAGIVIAIIVVIAGIGLVLGFTLKKKVDREAQLRDMFEMKKPQMGVGML